MISINHQKGLVFYDDCRVLRPGIGAGEVSFDVLGRDELIPRNFACQLVAHLFEKCEGVDNCARMLGMMFSVLSPIYCVSFGSGYQRSKDDTGSLSSVEPKAEHAIKVISDPFSIFKSKHEPVIHLHSFLNPFLSFEFL